MKFRWLLIILALAVIGNLQAATIHEAIDLGDSAGVAVMLDANPALLGERLPNGRTPLHTAAYGGKLNIVGLLLGRGADANATTSSGSTPLHGSALAGHEAVVRLLVAKGANPNIANQSGYTPLINAATSGSIPTMRCLMEAGANVEADTAREIFPLVAAVNSCNLEGVELLLNAGANPNRVSTDGSLIAIATLTVNWRIDGSERVPQILESLLKHGADPNLTLPSGSNPPLVFAAWTDDTAVLRLLLDGGANPNAVTRQGATPFGEAVELGRLNSVKYLLGRQARTDALDSASGRTPLHFAVSQGWAPMVEAVMPVTADLNAVDRAGMTPLDIAVRYGHSKIAESLRKGGAKPVAKKSGPLSSSYLAQKPVDGEAYLWYLGNCGYLIKTRNHCLVFDYSSPRVLPTEPSLANGFINPSDLASEDVTTFVTHEHGDHFDSTIFGWSGVIPKHRYVFGFKPDSLEERARQGYAGQPYEYVGPAMTKTIDGMQVMAVRSNDAGVGFVVTVDGLTIYHAGDLAGWRPDERQGFISQIDSIDVAFDSVDIALANVTGCHHQDTMALAEGTAYTLTKLHPKMVIPTHGGGREYYYAQFMEKFKGEFPDLLSFCPLGRGDAVKFVGGRKSAKVELL